jgi:hypothetical protein
MPAPGIVDACVGAPARSRPRPRCHAGGGPHRPRCHTARGAPPVRALLPEARSAQRGAPLPREPAESITNMNSTTTTGQPTDTTARTRSADPAARPVATLCTGNGRPQPAPPPPPLPPPPRAATDAQW